MDLNDWFFLEIHIWIVQRCSLWTRCDQQIPHWTVTPRVYCRVLFTFWMSAHTERVTKNSACSANRRHTSNPTTNIGVFVNFLCAKCTIPLLISECVHIFLYIICTNIEHVLHHLPAFCNIIYCLNFCSEFYLIFWWIKNVQLQPISWNGQV